MGLTLVFLREKQIWG